VYLEDLKADIAAGRVLVVAGTGVTVAATNAAPTADWLGLIEDGISTASQVAASLPPKWDEVTRGLLDLAKGGHMPSTLSVASQVLEALGGQGSGTYASWLRRAVGDLQLESRELIDAIADLGTPILTTNYDSLVSNALGREVATWQQVNHVQQALQEKSKDVIHLHGHWRAPDSVIFGAGDYGKIAANESIQALEQALSSMRVLLFVGCGAGLEDPNVGSLLKWLADRFPGSESRHYRLCRTDDLEGLQKLHQADNVTPLAFGNTHGDLPAFLRTLGSVSRSSSGLTAVTSPEAAYESLCGRVRSETVLNEHLRDVDTRSFNQVLVPPVVLPVSPEQFSAQQAAEKAQRPKRCDPAADVAARLTPLLVAQENAGLTSALEWLVAECHAQDKSLAPVLVDFKQLKSGNAPLDRQIRRELLLAGAIPDLKAPLPPCAVAIDNLSVRPVKIFDRVVEELLATNFSFVAIGSKQGEEADVREALATAGIDVTLRYLGRIRMTDAKRLADLLEPVRAQALAQKAMDIVQREHLPRTPLTISLLLSVLLHGEARLGTANETALLEAYIQLLLGRGDPHDDARLQLDSYEKADILETLAELHIAANAGSLPEADVIHALAEYFDAVTWDEDPVEALTNFRDLRLLTVRGGQVKFTQSSYLHLFAARRAMKDDLLKQTIFAEPLYYAPIIRHYAALTRNDAETLLKVEPLLDAALEVVTKGVSFRDVHVTPPEGSTVEELIEMIEGDAVVDSEDDAKRPPRAEVRERYDELMDRISADDDVEAFPLQNIDDAPDITKVWTITGLVSNVLRDSELVRDQDLKLRLLRKTLKVWGTFVKVLDDEEPYAHLMRNLANGMADVYGLSGEDREDMIDEFVISAPVFTAMGGMSKTLASRKLTRLLDLCFAEEAFVADREQAIMAAILSFDLQQVGWAQHFKTVRETHSKALAVNLAMYKLGAVSFYSDRVRTGELDNLVDFLVGVYSATVAHSPNKPELDRVAQSLRKRRALEIAKQKAIGTGSTSPQVIEGELAADE
jgi:hypothetical protein